MQEPPAPAPAPGPPAAPPGASPPPAAAVGGVGGHEEARARQQQEEETAAAPPPLPADSLLAAASAQAAASAPAQPAASPGGGRGPLPPPPALYVFSPTLAALSSRLTVNQDRPTLVHSLIAALPSFLDGSLAVARVAAPATAADLSLFHTHPYLSLLAGGWTTADEATLSTAGLEDDCPPFEGLWEVVTHTAGCTLTAARALVSGRATTAFALDGGRHHARPSSAAGFCYANDCVLGVLELKRTFARVLYLDLDVHAGDGVESAFAGDPSVLTASLHHARPGFYPGTGGIAGAGGVGRGAGFALNLPLARGTRDATVLGAVAALLPPAVALFRPGALVLQLGADGLARDPLADAWSLSPAVFGRLTAAVRDAIGLSTPLLVLGGGGYSSTETAKAWACGVCGAVGVVPPEDVPDHAHAHRYGPTWRLGACGSPPTVRDENEEGVVAEGVRACLEGLAAGVARESGGPACEQKRKG